MSRRMIEARGLKDASVAGAWDDKPRIGFFVTVEDGPAGTAGREVLVHLTKAEVASLLADIEMEEALVARKKENAK